MNGQVYVYTMRNVNKVYPGGREVLKDINLQFLADAKIGVLGLNGAGKSTLLKIMAGIEETSSGEAWPAEGIKVGYLPQEPILDPNLTVAENIGQALDEVREVLNRFEEVSLALGEDIDMEQMNKLLEEQAELQEQIDAADAWDLERVIEIAMAALRCPSGDSSIENLSGGEVRRVALCRLLLSKPDILLLDEPTNHLDVLSVAWLQRFLSEYKGMVVVVTHDRYFLDNVTDWILELDRGVGIPYQGNYSGWLEQKCQRLQQSGKTDTERLQTLVKEKEWIGSSPSARRAKSKARIKAYEKLVTEHKDRQKQTGSAKITIPLSQRLGDVVVKASNLRKMFGDKLLFDEVNFSLPAGGIVGVIGGNGSGKTTLLRMIIGQESPDLGNLKIGETVDLGYVDQSRDILNSKDSVFEAISEGESIISVEGRDIPSRAYVGAFNFRGSDQEKIVGQLSGGERNRVHLARILKKGCNLLLLDEPTNDLDVETLRALEEAIENFPGSIIVVSHDRWFLDRVASHILAFEGDSKVVWFEGNYKEYEEDLRKRLGVDADLPKPVKYRPLTV